MIVNDGTLHVKMPKELKEKALRKAKSEGASLATIVRQFLVLWTKEQEK